MEFDRLFEDLEGQLAAEWEAERAALNAESERLRIAKLSLRDRLRILVATQERALLELPGGDREECVLRIIGADWIGVSAAPKGRLRLVPLNAVCAIGADHGAVLASLGTDSADSTEGLALRERMTFGFILRDLARRRTPVTVSRRGADPQHGTIDRAGSDHLDLAVHDRGQPRITRSVRAFRVIPFSSVRWVRLESDEPTLD